MKKLWEFIKKHKKAIIIIAIVAVVGFGVFKIVQYVNNAKNLLAGMQNSASTEVVETRDIVNSVTATGTIVAVDKRTVSSTVTGVKVKQLNVKVGDQVQAGDILCLLDGENLEQQLADAQKMLNADASRSSLDVNSSNRSLNEAITDRNISATRAEEDKNTAYNHVQDAANECQEAKDNYDKAVNDTATLKWKMEDAEARRDEAYKKSAAPLSADQIAEAVDPYVEAYGRFDSYMQTVEADAAENVSVISNWRHAIEPSTLMSGSGDFNIIGTSVSMVYNGDTWEIYNKVSESIDELKNCYQQYVSVMTSGQNAISMEIQNAEAAYAQAKAAYEAALLQEESQKSLYESKAKTVESMIESYNSVLRNVDDSKRNNDSNVAARQDSVKNSQLSASTATLSDKRTVAQLQEQIDSCVVTASIGGIVTDVSVIEGEDYVGGAIVTIENTTDYEVSALIDEYDIAKIEVGQEVVIKTNGTGDLKMKGQVKSIAPHASTQVGTSGVKYEVMISVLDKNEDIRLDMTAKIEIICEKAEAVLSVASEAIQEDEDGKFYVEILDSGKPFDSSKLLSNPEEVDEEELAKVQEGEQSYESHKAYITKGLVGDYYTEISGDEIEDGTEIVIPNDGAFSDIEEYMNQAGSTGGF